MRLFTLYLLFLLCSPLTPVFGASAEALIEVLKDTIFEFFTHVKAEISASASSAITGWGTYSEEDGWDGDVNYGDVVAKGTVKGEIDGVGSFTFEISKKLLEGS